MTEGDASKAFQGALKGEVQLPGDKSISHRACMFAGIARGDSIVRTASLGRDNMATLRVLGQLGVQFQLLLDSQLAQLAGDEGLQYQKREKAGAEIRIEGLGLDSFQKPEETLFCGNSGTTARLMIGLLASSRFPVTLDGDESLRSRPFKRISDPLAKMGVAFNGDNLPMTFEGGDLQAISYESPRASAQVKSAILLAGLNAKGETSVTEPGRSRDHTERMLEAMAVPLKESESSGGWVVTLPSSAGARELKPLEITVPGDFSAAAFFLVAGSIFPDSEIVLKGVGVNPTRTGLLDILSRMGADIALNDQRVIGGEPVADLTVKSTSLKAVEIGKEDVVLSIDEIPVACLAAAMASGKTVISGAEELRVKESDRIARMTQLLRSFGVDVEETADGMEITGAAERLRRGELNHAAEDAPWRRCGDHRIAMCGAIFELLVTSEFQLQDVAAVETSFPGFKRQLEALITGPDTRNFSPAA